MDTTTLERPVAQPPTALTLPQRAAAALGESANEAKLRELVAKSSGIVTVTNADGRDEAHRAGMVLLKTRTGIRATGKAARDDATKFSKAVIAMEDELIGIIEPEETRVLALRDAWDEQIAAEKAAKIAQERARVEAIQARIEAVRALSAATIGKTAAEISQMINELASTITEDQAHAATFEDFADQYKAVRADVLHQLAQAETKQLGIEADAIAAEQARIAEAARIEVERAELARQRAENERVANEQAKERQRLADLEAAQERAAAELRQKAEANLRAEREAQEKALADQQAALAEQARLLAEQQAAADERDRIARQAAEDAKRRDDDHAVALVLNAEFDECVAERRLQAQYDQAFIDSRQPATLDDLVAAANDIDELIPTDAEILDIGTEFGMTPAEWIARLELFVVAARAELVV